MRYIVINKFTNNMVEKIIFPEGGFIPSKEMFPNYLDVIIDEDDIVQSFDMRFDETTNSFVQTTEKDLINKNYEQLKEENLKLKIALAELTEQRDEEMLNIKLALAEIVEGGL